MLPLLPSLLLLSATLTQTTALPSPKLHLTALTTQGRGCPTNTSLSVTISPDSTAITLTYDPPLTLSLGPTTTPADRSKSCIALLTLCHPSTERFSLSSTTYRGTAALDAGVTATLRTLYSDAGTGSGASSSSVVAGPLAGTYVRESGAQGAGDRLWTSWPRREETVVRVDTTAGVTAATTAGAGGSVWGEAVFALEGQVVGVVWVEG
ncbi:hypothetical protein QBC39DRAFT_326269 [Podospora conica]|nr:hypothetical protein QBC39DRAFT_326269 [Schizothecium conicum]